MSFTGGGAGGSPTDLKTVSLTRTLPVTGSYVELGKFVNDHVPIILDVSITALDIAKRYIVTVGDPDPAGGWYRLFAISSYKITAEDFDLYIYKNDTLSETVLRFYRLAGSITGNFNVVIRYSAGTEFVSLIGSGSMGTLDNRWPSTALSQFGNQVVVGEDTYLNSGSENARLIIISDVEPLPTAWTDAQFQIHNEASPGNKLVAGLNRSDGRAMLQSGRQGFDWTALHLQGRGGGVVVGENASTNKNSELQVKAEAGTKAHIKFLNSATPTLLEDGQLWYNGSDILVRISGATYKLDKTAV